MYLLLNYIGADDCQRRHVRGRCYVCRIKPGRKICELGEIGCCNAIAELSHKPRSLQPSSAVLQLQSTLVVPRLYSAHTKVSMKGFRGIRRYRRQSLCVRNKLAPRPPLLRFLYHTQLDSPSPPPPTHTHIHSRTPLNE